jgi:hypothetical protein
MNMVGHRKTLPGFAFEVLIAAHLHGQIAGKAQACFKLRPSKSTVELLANGQVSAALDALQKQGRVQEIPNREKRIRAIAKSYVESPKTRSLSRRTSAYIKIRTASFLPATASNSPLRTVTQRRQS